MLDSRKAIIWTRIGLSTIGLQNTRQVSFNCNSTMSKTAVQNNDSRPSLRLRRRYGGGGGVEPPQAQASLRPFPMTKPETCEMLQYCPLADLGKRFWKKMALNMRKITARRRTSLCYSTIMNDGNNREVNYQSQNDFSSAHRCASPAH